MAEYGLLPDLADPALFMRPHAGDDSLFVVFYMGVIQNTARTTEAGRPIFDDVECVRIIVPGDKNNINDRPASAEDKARFPKQYGAFREGRKEEDQISGTRLNEWPFLTRGQCEEFRYLGLRTVEQLAEVRDDVCTKVPGLQQLKRHAQIWLEKAGKTAESAKIAKAMDEQASQIETLKAALADQAAVIESLRKVKA